MTGQTETTATRTTIGRLSAATACHIETIRYYERIGLIPRPARSAGGYRIYGPGAGARLAFIRRARELGFSLEQIRTLLRLVDGGHYTCAQIRTLAINHLEDIRRKTADLRSMERALADMASRCVGGRVPRCAIIDALFDKTLPRRPGSIAPDRRKRGASRPSN